MATDDHNGTWPAYIVRALLPHPDCTEKQDALAAIRRDCERRGRRMPRSYSDTVQASFEAHNSGSKVFAQRRTTRDADLFYFAGIKGDGKWGLHVGRAFAWMKKQGYDLG
ncbi:MAG: hypothetical protein ABL962_19730 [Fimbriimonadaceae bacterium]